VRNLLGKLVGRTLGGDARIVNLEAGRG